MRHRTVGADDENVRFARALRRKMSLPEVLLWQELRKHPAGLRFRRQFPIENYILDFACLSRRLAIEIDGEAHSRGDRPLRDEVRDAVLTSLGFDTLRIPARDVLSDMDAIVTLISFRCEDRPLHHPASPDGPPPRSGEDFS